MVRGLVPGTGVARYIYASGTAVTISGNQPLAVPLTAENKGYGFYGVGASTLCLDNSVSPMVFAKYLSCDAAIGNF